jgi:hypothetical protein
LTVNFTLWVITARNNFENKRREGKDELKTLVGLSIPGLVDGADGAA